MQPFLFQSNETCLSAQLIDFLYFQTLPNG
jgi:hypothetical protein